MEIVVIRKSLLEGGKAPAGFYSQQQHSDGNTYLYHERDDSEPFTYWSEAFTPEGIWDPE